MPDEDLMAKIVSLAKRRGFIFQSSEIYGGLNSCWDYGPLGVELKRNVKDEWWRAMVHTRDDIVGLDAAILMHPKVWETSGHVSSFTDPLVDCRNCKARFREDTAPTNDAGKTVCPECESANLTEARQFNLMFKTFMGPVEDDSATVYLRPETAQGIFVNFLNVQAACRMKPPFGVAQIGKSFRNEITPGNFTYRTREFEQMEMEFFVPPGTDEKWYAYWKTARLEWYAALGLSREKLRLRDHTAEEMAHYAKACVDVEYLFPFGWSELEGVANRTDFDLSAHGGATRTKLSYFDPDSKERYVPYVIEPAAGADRAALAFLVDAYAEEEVRGEKRVTLRLHPRLAPVKAAVLPLVRRDNMPEKAHAIVDAFRAAGVNAMYDEAGSVGRRYRRQDEAGTPWCLTVDSQTLQDGSVTIRDRDSMEQERIASSEAVAVVRAKLDKS